jgi:phage-related protein
MKKYTVEFFEKARDFLYAISTDDRSLLLSRVSDLAEDISSVETKLLKSPIKELKYKKYRLLFFIDKSTIYFISGFVKKTQKTPAKEIEYANKLYSKFKE